MSAHNSGINIAMNYSFRHEEENFTVLNISREYMSGIVHYRKIGTKQ
jgi:hypothetical protein